MAKTKREIIRIVKVRKLSYFGHICETGFTTGKRDRDPELIGVLTS